MRIPVAAVHIKTNRIGQLFQGMKSNIKNKLMKISACLKNFDIFYIINTKNEQRRLIKI